MDVYLDHHATTPCLPEVVDAMLPWFTQHFGNAASRSHGWGQRARTAVEHARGQLALQFGCSPKSIVFTSGATEADNLAILGVLRANRKRGDHVVTVATEHKAVLDTVEAASREGFRVTVVPPEPDGRVCPQRILDALTERTVLVSVMAVNNETGTLQPIERIGQICRDRDILFHTDAAQAPCWWPLDFRNLPVDLLSLSAHKLYGPKGIGALLVRRGRPKILVEPLLHGGGHERGMRSGTLPVPLIVGFGEAAARLDRSGLQAVAARRDRLEQALLELGDTSVNGSTEHRVAGNLNVCVRGLDVRALMLACSGIGMSSGSACTSESLKPSHVLRAMGISSEDAASSLRFGVGLHTTDDEVDAAIEQLTAGIRKVRALSA